jgi:1A family penicillin-binding protein
MKRLLLTGLLVVATLGLAGFSWVWFAPCWMGGCAPISDLAEYQAEGSELLDAEGRPFARLATVNRRIVTLDSLPEHIPQAFIAIEDQRFYRHGGVDFTRTVGAMVRNIRSRQVEEGASTITQQLARNLFPDWLPYRERNLRRKVFEARVARQLERALSKDKILELYLNHIYLGSGAYGIEAASLTYFGKPAAELTLMEAATLAGVPQAPSQGNPKENMDRATRRRNLVLDQMARAGFITPAEAEEAKNTEIVLSEADASTEGPESSYFVERVRRELEETVGSRFYTAGLRIHTTLDPVAQSAAEEELRRQLDAVESGRFGAYRHATYRGERGEGSPAYLQGAVVVIEAATGEVRALVGGRDYADSNFDRATQALRQAGSAFKPFVYASALERYGSPIHRVEDSPLRLTLSGGRVWEPGNYNNQYDGPITMRDALARSKNTATVRLAQDVGIGSAVRVAHSAGLTTDIPEVPATSLGAADVRPIEMVGAYAAFANGGQRVQPHLIRRVVDRNGIVIWEASHRTERAMDPAVAFVLTSMMRDVVERGTGGAVRSVGFRGPAAGKTGTTNDASDVWFIGYTPDLVAGVWIGLDRPATIVRGASGGTIAAPVWGRLMQRIYASRPMPADWRAPSGVATATVDRVTGVVVSDLCPGQGATYTEYFVRSAPAPQRCPGEYRDPLFTSDEGWIDEEWGDFDLDGVEAEIEPSYGGDWPELEALRRRMEQAREGMRETPVRPGERDDLPPVIGSPTPGAGPPATPPGPGAPPTPAAPPTAPPPPPPPAERDEPETREPPALLGEPVPQRE